MYECMSNVLDFLGYLYEWYAAVLKISLCKTLSNGAVLQGVPLFVMDSTM